MSQKLCAHVLAAESLKPWYMTKFAHADYLHVTTDLIKPWHMQASFTLFEVFPACSLSVRITMTRDIPPSCLAYAAQIGAYTH